jgi:transcription antitermination protein NusB
MRRTDQRRAAIFALYEHEVTGAPLADLIERGPFPDAHGAEQEAPVQAGPLTEFAGDLVRGVQERGAELDALISRASEGWALERIAPLERSILRVALYEVLHRPDVPDEVALDEAVEAAKTFCGTDAPAFVNGVLGGVVRGLERDHVSGPGGPSA